MNPRNCHNFEFFRTALTGVLSRNLDCFSRGLLRDALEQLAGLKRRKLALEMLQELDKQAHTLQQEEEGNTLFVTGAFTHITEQEK